MIVQKGFSALSKGHSKNFVGQSRSGQGVLDVYKRQALEDDLMRHFGGERIKNILERFSGGESIPLEYGFMTKQIEKAQKRIEERNFQIRSHVLKYDDVMNQQRAVIYGQRRKVLMGEDISENIQGRIQGVI